MREHALANLIESWCDCGDEGCVESAYRAAVVAALADENMRTQDRIQDAYHEGREHCCGITMQQYYEAAHGEPRPSEIPPSPRLGWIAPGGPRSRGILGYFAEGRAKFAKEGPVAYEFGSRGWSSGPIAQWYRVTSFVEAVAVPKSALRDLAERLKNDVDMSDAEARIVTRFLEDVDSANGDLAWIDPMAAAGACNHGFSTTCRNCAEEGT